MVRLSLAPLLAALLMVSLSCAGKSTLSESVPLAPEFGVPGTGPAFPDLSDLRLGSDIVNADVFAPIDAAGETNGSKGLLLLPELVAKDGQPATAYAVYGLYIDPASVAVTVRVTSDYVTPNYIALGDWDNQRWDFGQGKYFGTFTILLDDLPGGRDRWVNDEGLLVLALLMHGTTGQNSINALEVVRTGEVTNLAATVDRYDGIRLSWTLPEDLDALLVERRLAQSEDAWEVLTPEPLHYLTTKFMDIGAAPPFIYEYRVSTGLRVTVATGQEWCWSPGVTCTGQRSGIVVDTSVSKPMSYVPANLYKYMSFFVQPQDQPAEVQAVKSESYPPQNNWLVIDSSVGLGPFELNPTAGLDLPFNLHQNELVNAPFTTLGFSREDGTYIQMVNATESGLINVEAPVKMLDAGSHFFGFVELPRSLGAIYWDSQLQQLKMRQSWDEIGEEWRLEDEMQTDWVVIGGNLPEGPIYMESKFAEPHLTYRDANSGALILKVLNNSWIDEGPAGISGHRPEIRQVMSASLLPGKALFWIPEDHGAVNMMLQGFPGDWMWETQVSLNAEVVGESGPVTEFDVYTGGTPSWDNYLVFVQGGHAYLLHSGSSNLEAWSSPILIDGTGTCSNLKLIVVGSAADFSFKLFATYLLEDGQGNSQICFRDMGQLKQEAILGE